MFPAYTIVGFISLIGVEFSRTLWYDVPAKQKREHLNPKNATQRIHVYMGLPLDHNGEERPWIELYSVEEIFRLVAALNKKEDTIMKDNTNLTTDGQRIASLIRNGARVKLPDGTIEPLTVDFYHIAVEECVIGEYTAVVYDMILPDVKEELALCVWPDGHVDSGTMKTICDFLTAR